MPQPLRDFADPLSLTTPIIFGGCFPEILERAFEKYKKDIIAFQKMVAEVESTADLLRKIRSECKDKDQRMSFLKMFRRCVSLAADTELTKKITKVSTESIVENLGATFKDIKTLKAQFADITEEQMAALAALMGEYDLRGQLGYELTARFFPWFRETFPKLTIIGPEGAGKDIELSTVIPGLDPSDKYPCDFVVFAGKELQLVGFARYDSSRGGAQSDDRPGGNSNKVDKARAIADKHKIDFRMLFLADGPGLAHGDTWDEACRLDGQWDGRVRVTTLKLLQTHVSEGWILGTEK